MNRILCLVVFIAGLAAIAWTGAAYVGSNPLALAVTALIAIVYLAGAIELYRYHRATEGLARAVGRLSGPPDDLGAWLSALNPGLRNAVRLRIEGVRTGLPGPSMTPYLVGLLVLLGMLGTFLGMVATLRGTGLALEGATDLQAIRDSLATPVKGLGFAFGTSVAGVASSAMLGLLSALLRRERIVAAQVLDTHIATSLRVHSQAHQRDESLRLLQKQADALPTVVDELKAVMAAMATHQQTLNEQLAASQASFQASTEAAYTRLATSVEQSLRDGIAEGARAAGTAIEPIAQTTLAGLTSQATAVHDRVTQSLQQQLDAVSARLDATAAAMSQTWNAAVIQHQDASATLTNSLRASVDELLASTGERSGAMLQDVSARLDGLASAIAGTWDTAFTRQEQASQKLAEDNRTALTAAVAAMAGHSTALVHSLDASHGALQASLAQQDEERLAAWAGKVDAMVAALRQSWTQAGEQTTARQQEICAALGKAALDITTETQANARATIGEISKLVQTASEAPRAAADVINEVRQKLSDSLVRDNAVLEERSRLLETVGTLLDAVNHASSEQRAAVDALVSTSADMLERVGRQFTDTVQVQAGQFTETMQVQAGQFAETVQAQAGQFSETAGAEIQKLTGAVDAQSRQLSETIGAETGKLAGAIETGTGTLASAIESGTGKLAEAVEAGTGKFAGSVETEGARLAAAVEAGAGKFAGAVETETSKLAEALEAGTGKFAGAVETEAGKLAVAVEAGTGKLAGAVEAETGKLAEAVQAGTGKFAGTLETEAARLAGAVEAGTGMLAGAVQAEAGKISTVVETETRTLAGRVEADSGKLAEAGALVSRSAIEVASLGAAFASAVQAFGASASSLESHLQRLEAALEKSIARSDEQLAYYVAQAREVVDLSLMSQRQVLEELQRMADRKVAEGPEAA